MASAKKPAPFDNSWLGNTATNAKLQVIGDDDKWHTLGECLDTPNSIEAELRRPEYKGQSIWIKTPFGRHYHGQVK